jgi:DNA-binding IclR family transcriptional regulator
MSKAPAVDYAIEIIEFFANHNTEIGIADISNALHINKNAVSRVLDVLLEKSWIYMSNHTQKKYRLTLRPFSLIGGHTRNSDIAKIAAPYVENLNKELGVSVYLGVKNGKNVLYLLHYDSNKEVRINGRVGGEYPLHCAAPGKVLLSYADVEEIKDYFNTPITKTTTNTITDFPSFITEADTIKQSAYAIDNEEFAQGIICIAVPVFDCTGSVVATICISSLTFYDNVETLIHEKLPLIKNIANQISINLGYLGKALL